MQQSGTLYIVATPIGNLGDLSPRVKETLGQVDLIACEDTRHSGRLLQHLGISKPMVSMHEHNEGARVQQIMARLEQGESVALISDAGIPLLSDPGYPLVRDVVAAGFRLCPIPGPNAALTALCVSGLPPEPFRFLGFPPRQGAARRKYLATVAEVSDTLVFYESIHRLKETLTDLADIFGADRSAMVGRELTKQHEQLRHGGLAELAEWASEAAEARKGEAVVVVGGAPPTEDDGEVCVSVDALLGRLAEVMPPRKAAQLVAELSGLAKNQLYRRLMASRDD